jgi:hypothetical protein
MHTLVVFEVLCLKLFTITEYKLFPAHELILGKNNIIFYLKHGEYLQQNYF